jgi:hypothetical protein
MYSVHTAVPTGRYVYLVGAAVPQSLVLFFEFCPGRGGHEFLLQALDANII